MIPFSLILLIAAFILFVIAASGKLPWPGFVALGLACWVLAQIIGHVVAK